MSGGWGRVIGVFGLVLALLVGLAGGVGVAAADTPKLPAVSKDASAIADWPLPLQQLVVGTAAFQKGPWFTDPSCKDKGGNVGVYINTYMAHEREFMLQLAKSTESGNADAKAFIDAAGGTNKFQTWPGDDPRVASFTMPTKNACATTLAQWGVPDSTSVWGFNWTAAPDAESAKQMNDLLSSMKIQDDLDPTHVQKWGQNADTDYIKAHAFFLDCSHASGRDVGLCQGWNRESETLMIGADAWKAAQKSFWDKAGLFFKMVGFGIITSPAWVGVACGFVLTMVGKVLGAVVDYAAKKGMDQVVAFFTGALVTVWGAFTSWMVNFTTPNLLAGGFVDTYNLISGVILGLAFLGWLAALGLAWKRGRLGQSIWGALKGVLGIQLVGVLAYFMLTLAREATTLLISGHIQSIQSAKFATSLVAVNPAVGLLAAVFGLLGLLGAFLVLLFQIPLVFGYALFGTVAAAGSVHPASSGWLSKWFFSFLSLCWTPFFMVGMSILGQNLVAGLDSNTTQNLGQQMATVLGGLLIMVLLPTTPWLLSGVMSSTVGRVSAAADAIGEKFSSQALSAAGDAGAAGADTAGRALRAGAGDTWGALATMGSNLVTLGEWGGGGSGAGADTAGAGAGGAGAGGDTADAQATMGGASAGAGKAGAGAAGAAGGAAGGAAAAAGGVAGAAVAAGKALIGKSAQMAQGGADPGSTGSNNGGAGSSSGGVDLGKAAASGGAGSSSGGVDLGKAAASGDAGGAPNSSGSGAANPSAPSGRNENGDQTARAEQTVGSGARGQIGPDAGPESAGQETLPASAEQFADGHSDTEEFTGGHPDTGSGVADPMTDPADGSAGSGEAMPGRAQAPGEGGAMTDPAGADGPDTQSGVGPAPLPIGAVPDGGGGTTAPDADGLVPGVPEPSAVPGPAAAANPPPGVDGGAGAAPSGTPVLDGGAGGAPSPAPVGGGAGAAPIPAPVGGDAGAVGGAVAAVSGGWHQQGPAADSLPGTGGDSQSGGNGQAGSAPSVSAGYREDGGFGDPEPAVRRPGWGQWWDASTFPAGVGGFQASRAARDAADLSDFGGGGGGAAAAAPQPPVRRPPVRVPDDSFPRPSAPATPSRSDNGRNEQSND